MSRRDPDEVDAYLRSFILEDDSSGQCTFSEGTTLQDVISVSGEKITRYTNEFWTARQRQAARVHEISYRACFKPQLPRFFIKLLTEPGDLVYDPFAGRGTTPLEAGLLGRKVVANDINPLSRILTVPRFFIPDPAEVKARLLSIPYISGLKVERDLSMFFHPETEAEILSLRTYILAREHTGSLDHLDQWIRMVATNRLTGHSPGFFSVYTLPPNQAVSPERQIKINETRGQQPPYRSTRDIILKKTRILVKDLTRQEIQNLREAGEKILFITGDARQTSSIEENSVRLTVTSPPFLDIVQYSADNWLRCWFNGIDEEEIGSKITKLPKVTDWTDVMQGVFHELYRITQPDGWVAFEVGEVRNRTVMLDEVIVPVGMNAGFTCVGIVVNSQEFTKTANIWGVSNMEIGTNTNRIVLFQKEG
ncbi:DNA methyltransferase [Methanospirillum lacunae]|uniref:DNA modification methylase n=1 Tax=Methanospirillum lacunae TaxID=668570 RepID=A0A2V2MQ06_9EURY|nr:DNA methyltransferase [Methanospirillum lacunae]PWR70192.1 DNA modification methylase [Methanospirillum lacunae]